MTTLSVNAKKWNSIYAFAIKISTNKQKSKIYDSYNKLLIWLW